MPSILSGDVRVIGKEIVDAKLLAAAPRILAHNRLMVGQMLGFVKAEVVPQIPIGPGHFGYHLRDSFTTDVSSKGVTTTGVLKSPATGYWREYGTQSRFRRSGSRRSYAAALGVLGTGGERAYMTAHHALAGIKKFLYFYYGRQQWWGLR